MYTLARRLAVSTCVLLLAAAPVASAAGPKDYQITGIIQSVNDSVIVLKKGNELWELGRDANTKGIEALKVGDKVTLHYTMTASTAEPKAAINKAAGKKDKKADDAADAAPSPKA